LKYLGRNWFGSLWLFLSMLSLVGWCFVMHLSLNIRWHVGVFLENWSAFSAMVRLSVKTISSSAAALVVVYGGLLCRLVSSLILLCCRDEVVDWAREKICGKTLQSLLGRLCVGAVIYHLWRHRNDLLHGNSLRSEEVILVQILWEVHGRVLAKGRFRNCPKT
jgi:hypothetical protein